MTASAPQTRARPRYSVSSNGPMAFTVQSNFMADASAIVLPTSSAHHAQRSPRRKAVTAMALAISPNTTLYAPYIRKITVMNAAVIGDVPASSDHEPRRSPRTPRPGSALPAWSEQMIRRQRRHRAPRDVSHVDNQDEHQGDDAFASSPSSRFQIRVGLSISQPLRSSWRRNAQSGYAGNPPVSLRIHRMHVCPKSTPGPYIIGQAPAITLISC